MADTPGRRTRTSTRASATPAPSTAGGRRPRARTPKALPAVPVAKSHAYGATGKVELATQLDDPSGGAIGFAARFGADRGAAVGRQIEESAPSAISAPASNINTTPVTRRIPPTALLAPSSVLSAGKVSTPQYLRAEGNNHSSDDDDDDDDDVDDYAYDRDDLEPNDDRSVRRVGSDVDAGSFTDLETHFSYTTSMPPSSKSRRVAELQPPATTEEREAAQPWNVSVFLETIHRRLHEFETSWVRSPPHFKRTCLGLLMGLLLLLSFGPSKWAGFLERTTDLCYQAGEYATKPFSYLHQRGGGVGQEYLSERMRDLELQMRGIKQHVQEINPDEIRRLQNLLPEQIIVRKNEKTGQFELPPNFWHALQAKLDERDTENTWDKFVEANKNRLKQHAEDVIENTIKHRHVISREMLTNVVKENHAELSKKFSGQLRAFEASVRKSAENAARRTVTDVIKSTPDRKDSVQLPGLALANIVFNTELRLKSVNYFSHTYGATVHPRYTSPTHARQLGSFGQWFSRNVYDFEGRGYPSASRALTPWEEPADCWCAAASDDMGKAQIGVLMPRAMRPKSITIEHMPAKGTLDIGAAPRAFEVWVRSRDGMNLPRDVNSHLECGEAPDRDFVCIGKDTYQIEADNHIQNFDLEDVEDVIGFVDFAVFRVVNNWGQDWTCIYRVRMHGDPEPTELEHSTSSEL